MKKLLFIVMAAGFFTANAQTTTVTDKLIVNSISSDIFATQIGPIATGTKRQFNFMLDGLSNDQVIFNMYNSNGGQKFDLYFSDTQSYLKINDFNNGEAFKFASTSSLGNFIHMPSSNSRIVIGGYGNYLYNDGHKLVVQNGSAMIEGNILTNSSIGIGTSSFVDGSDIYKLSVNGKIRAESVKVYTGWADYVFEEDYNLPTLEEVENYIKQNGHLKDIPSAKEVEENGIELGEMNKLLLQKIEELTLYTIELKKEVDELRAKI